MVKMNNHTLALTVFPVEDVSMLEEMKCFKTVENRICVWFFCKQVGLKNNP